MANQPNIVSAKAMPPQTITPLAAGATSPMSSAQIQQQQAVQKQMSLIGKTGGSRRKRLKGGANLIQVPPIQPGTPNQTQNTNTMKDITRVAVTQQEQAKFDSQVKTGGKNIKGGTWPVWGCLSGGKKRKCRKSRKCRRSRKCRKSRRNRH
jgi:hypothetical protein